MAAARTKAQREQRRRHRQWLWYSLKIRTKHLVRSLLRARGSPEAIAFGFAIGLFIGFMPLYGVQILLAGVLATALGASRIPAIAAVWVTNPLTAIPVYGFCYRVGLYLLGRSASGGWTKIEEILHGGEGPWLAVMFEKLGQLIELSWRMIGPLITGCTTLGLLFGLMSYPFVVRLVKGHRLVRAQRRARRWQKRIQAQTRAAGHVETTPPDGDGHE